MTGAWVAKVKRKKYVMSQVAKDFDKKKMKEYRQRMVAYFNGNYVK